MPEAGLRVIRSGGPAPWEDLDGFIERVIVLCRHDLEDCGDRNGPVVFDRGLFDAFSGYASRNKADIRDLMPRPFPYAQPVFFAPHWPAIFEQTEERRLPVEAAIEEADRLMRDLRLLDIAVVELPFCSAPQRADLVLKTIS